MRITDNQISMGANRQYYKFGSSPSFSDTISETKETNKNNDLRNSAKPSDFQSRVLSQLLKRLMSTINGSLSGGLSGRQVVYEEYEETSFFTSGSVQTEDGRTIDFSLDITMSRSYMEYTNTPVNALQNALCDPLILNLDSLPAGISDQKFTFDIDADGTPDSISSLRNGCGFLALDQNEDGIINDGSELFGTKSGDGFADLRTYDSDGNGWIDEADDIFQKLKIWYRTEDGTDCLLSLRDAGVGAIYLGSQNTEFSHYDAYGMLNGVVRKTGFFLKENGLPGSIQHIDLAKSDPDVSSKERLSHGALIISADDVDKTDTKKKHTKQNSSSSGANSSDSGSRIDESESTSVSDKSAKAEEEKRLSKQKRETEFEKHRLRRQKLMEERFERNRLARNARKEQIEDYLEKINEMQAYYVERDRKLR